MKKQTLILSSLLFLFSCCFMVTVNAQGNTGDTQDCGPINQSKLKEILVQLGHPIKDLSTTPGQEKYEISIKKDGFNVPIGLEISPSTHYIWLTVFLGKAPADSSVYFSLIKENSKIQPALFYVTDSGSLMVGLPVDNRGMNNTLLKRYTDFIAGKVSDTRNYWQ